MPVVSWPTAPHIVVMIGEKSDPLALFSDWYDEAAKSEPNDPSAMTLATVGPDGTPSVRMVLLKDFDASGFVFYTNHASRKGQHLLAHPKAALLFHWKSLRRQVRLEGPASPTTSEEADAYLRRARGAARSAPGPRISRSRWRVALLSRRGWRSLRPGTSSARCRDRRTGRVSGCSRC